MSLIFSMQPAKRRLHESWWWASVLVMAAASRWFVFVDVPPRGGGGVLSYVNVLHAHWDALVLRGTLLPPLNYVIEALPILVLGPSNNGALNGTLWSHGAMGVGASSVVFATMRVLKVPRIGAALVAIAMSLALIPFEMWGWRMDGGHYDVPTPLFMALFGYAVARAAEHGLGGREAWLLGSLGALLMLQMATAAYFVPVMAVIVIGTGAALRRFRATPLRIAAPILGLPLLVLAALTVKNGTVTGVYAPGTRGGAPLMMFVQNAMGGSDDAVRQLAVEAGVPEWYLWCYDRPELPPGERMEGMWGRLARAFGTCAPWSAGPGIDGQPWPFDFSGIVSQLEMQGRPDLAAMVRADQHDAIARQWVFAGHSPELSARWVPIYGRESQRVGSHLLRTQPYRYVATAWRLHRDLFWGRGPEFLGQSTYWAGVDYRQRAALGRFVRFGFSALIRMAYVLLPVAVVLAAWAWWRARRRGGSEDAARRLCAYGWLLLPVAACAVIYSAAVAVENDRYFVHIVPMLTIVAGLLFRDLTDIFRGRSHA